MKSIYDLCDAAALAGVADLKNEDLVKYTSSKRVTIIDAWYNLYRVGMLPNSYVDAVCIYSSTAYIVSFSYSKDNGIESKIKATFNYWTDYELSHLYGLLVIIDNELYYALPDILEKQDLLKILKVFYSETGFNVNSAVSGPWNWCRIN